MAFYEYKVIDKKSGETISGTVEATNKTTAVESLEKEGYLIDTIKKKKETDKQSNSILKRAINEKEVVLFTGQMYNLLKAGINLGEAVEILAKILKNGKLKKRIDNIYEQMKNGKTFSESLSKYPDYFSEGYVNIVKAGEDGGFIEETFRRLHKNLKDNNEMKSFIISSLIYPIILSIVAVAAIAVMLVFVLPRFVKIYQNYGKTLPVTTQILIYLSNILSKYWWIALIIPVVAFFSIGSYYKTEKGHLNIDKLILKTFAIGEMTVMISAARVANSLGSMIVSGVPVIKAMEVVKYIPGNIVLQNEIERIKTDVKKGVALSSAFGESKYFPEILSYMTAIGERTGKQGEILMETASGFEEEIKRKMEFFTKIFEPAIILSMGVIIGIIVFAMLTPVMGINNMNMGGIK